MAIRVNFSKSKQPAAKVDQNQTFSGDRAALLARFAAPGAKPEVAPVVPVALDPGAPAGISAGPVAPPIDRASTTLLQAGGGGKSGGGGMPLAGAGGAAKAVSGSLASSSDRAGNDAETDTADLASEALLNPSSAPALIRATGLLTKWGMFAAVLLAIAVLATRYLLPFLEELRHPGKGEALADKNAPTAVRVIQQTRAVVAKSDANVSYLNEVVLATEDKRVMAPAAAPSHALVAKAGAALPARDDLTPYQEAIQRLQLGGVFDGDPPRIYLNGRIVKYAEIIDRNLGLRFIGIDVENKAVLFTNAANVTFRKYY